MFFELISLSLAIFRGIFFIFFLTFCSATANAQTINVNKGDVTGLPLPRFVSVKSNKVNVRRGPNSTYQIDWVYTKSGVPLKVIAEYENWRRVEDFQGEGGWIHSRLLSGNRFVIFLKNRTLLKRRPNEGSPTLAVVQQGVIAKFVDKNGLWSEVSVQGYSGWIRNESVW
jgi:SH3-like domain-containing protein